MVGKGECSSREPERFCYTERGAMQFIDPNPDVQRIVEWISSHTGLDPQFVAEWLVGQGLEGGKWMLLFLVGLIAGDLKKAVKRRIASFRKPPRSRSITRYRRRGQQRRSDQPKLF